MTGLDVVYCAWNRREFTAASFALLLANTDWSLVDRLIVYDDGSTDGTAEMLEQWVAETLPVETELRRTETSSPPALMNDYLSSSDAAAFVKVDNDIAVPPGWLETLVDVADRHPMFALIGIEAGRMGYPGQDFDHPVGDYRVEDCSHIGGVGYMRTKIFRGRDRRLPERGRFGFTEWQKTFAPARGWIFPDLLVPQLDRVPVDPWAALSARYVDEGWQRSWPSMDPHWSLPYFEWLPDEIPERGTR